MAIGGSGTQADPWTISSAVDLVAFTGSTSYWASGTYAVLTADIDMDGVSFTPIGNNSTRYQGTFDGQKHVISNLTISASSSNYQGLFGYVYNATIQNIWCEGFNITGRSYVGGLVGYAYSASISNCYAYNCTVSGSNFVGGLVGGASSASISNCAIYGGTHGDTLVGGGSPTITNCYTSNDVTSEIFHNQDFWNANTGGTLSQTYLSWDFVDTWEWDSSDSLPKLQEPKIITPGFKIKESGEWKDVDNTFVKVNGTWKEVSKVFTKVNSAWKEI